MKIFVWDDVSVLMQYAGGTVIVVASTVEEAISLASLEYGPDSKQPYGRMPYESQEALMKELRSNEPKVFDGPKAFIIMGSA